jgi:hypothetical protein
MPRPGRAVWVGSAVAVALTMNTPEGPLCWALGRSSRLAPKTAPAINITTTTAPAAYSAIDRQALAASCFCSSASFNSEGCQLRFWAE